MNNFSLALERYGADPAGVRLFGVDEPGLLPYATLISARNMGDENLNALCGVYEWQSSPLVFLVNGDEIRNEDHFLRIRRCVALRGDAPYLGVVGAGRLTIHRVSLDMDGRAACEFNTLSIKDERSTFQCLANFRPNVTSRRKWISQVVLKLLRETIRELRKHGVKGDDAISLTGRALFLRFLGDRKLLPTFLGPDRQLFDDARRTERTSRWVDDTFNGDLLPISNDIFAKLPEAAFNSLGNILYRAPGGQLHLEWQETWAYLDFAHIPVGVLSEAYEHYMREHEPDKQRKEGSYYTPRAIADLMVKASFYALRCEGKATDAIVLDPAAGAGVFLVSAFRQLVAERWIHDNMRPDTNTLRDILYRQIVGFDINEAALRFAALGLYLMSIELDPEPEPVGKLRFEKNLRGIVLHNLGNGTAAGLGSLGKMVSAEHVGHYDLVIGNPPWPGDTKLPEWSEVKANVDRIALERLPDGERPPPIPNEVLDLPFVWRAMEWAKPGGQIAFALHARLLFQQGNGMIEARSAIFRALDVTGVINGAELRQSQVWPEVSAPFCLLFARNQLPTPKSAFRFVSPHLEDGLNGAGVLRLDAVNAEMVTPAQVAARPEILKILFRGSPLDLEVFDRMKAQGLVTLEHYWRQRFGESKGRLKRVSTGYQRVCGSTTKPQSADHLHNKPDLPSDAILPLLINTSDLKKFSLPFLHRARNPKVYEAPILIVHKSPPTSDERIRVSMAEEDLVFNEVFYGYSGKTHPEAVLFIRYLTLLLGSKPALWYVLMTSGEFGFEREVVEKIIIDSILVVPFESLGHAALERINSLFNALVREDTPENWAEVDAWAAALYGMCEEDLQVINDTLRFNLPFAKNKSAAQITPSSKEVIAFCETLKNEMNPWTERENLTIEVHPVKFLSGSPWSVLQIYATSKYNGKCNIQVDEWPEVLRVADSLAATEVIHPIPGSGCLWIARLNQARYWSQSHARLVARQIVWEHMDTLFGSEAE